MNFDDNKDINGTPVIPGCRVVVATGWKKPVLVKGLVYRLSLSMSGNLTVCVKLESNDWIWNPKRAFRGTSRMMVINP